MRKIFFALGLATTLSSLPALADLPVFSANGFICGKEGVTVTCKGPIPGGKDTVTGTGHNLVYLTVNTQTQGVPTRYTYFSDTGCLIGYTFNSTGQPVEAVASHRKGVKQTFSFGDGKYDKIIDFCVQENPNGAPAQASAAAPASTPAKPAAVKSSVADKTQ